MRFLLDTHVLLWWIDDDPRLSSSVRAELTNASNQLFFSAASGWEISIKAGLGKLVIEGPPEQFLTEQLLENDIRELPVRMSHAARVCHLAMHHKDPFDRLLVAQAQIENLTILSDDSKIRIYPVDVYW